MRDPRNEFARLEVYDFVIHKAWFPWIMQPKKPCLIGGGSCNFQPSFRGGSVSFVSKRGDGPCVLLSTTFPNAPAHPTLYFLTSPLLTNFFVFQSCL